MNRLFSETAGTGPPVVFVHPGFADSRFWDP
jgi:pimeloyl-ACP methyl ester carboxylesterase